MATNSTHSKIQKTAAGGRDYSSIQAWEDDIGVGLGNSTNLVTDDYDHYGWVHAEEFDENVSVGGHTTDETHAIYLAADSNGATAPAAGHSHTKTDAALMDADRALAYNTSYAGILANNSYDGGLKITDDWFFCSRMQFRKTAGNNRAVQFQSTSGNDGIFDRCLFDASCTLTAGRTFITQYAPSGIKMHACLFISSGSSVSNNFPYNTDGEVINCTSVKDSTSTLSDTAKQITCSYYRPPAQNCALFAGGNGSEYFDTAGGAAYTLDYNATDFSDLTSESGEGTNNIYNLTMADQFAALDNTDWRLKAGNDLDTGGTDLTGTVALDIFGNSFNAGDIGCIASAGGGGVTLAVADALLSQATDAVALTQANTLSLADTLQAVAVDSPSLTQAHTLAIAAALHAIAAESLTLNVASTLSPADTLQAVAVDSPALTQAHTLAVADALQTIAADSLSLSVAVALVVAEALQAVTSENIDLTQSGALTVFGATQAMAADSVALTQSSTLTLADTVQAVAADSIVLSTAGILSVADALQAVTADSVALTQSSTLSVSETIQAISADGVELSQAIGINVADALMAITADPLTLTVKNVLTVASAVHAVTAANVDLTQASTLIVNDALFAMLADVVLITEGALTRDLYFGVEAKPRVFVVEAHDRVFVVARKS